MDGESKWGQYLDARRKFLDADAAARDAFPDIGAIDAEPNLPPNEYRALVILRSDAMENYRSARDAYWDEQSAIAKWWAALTDDDREELLAIKNKVLPGKHVASLTAAIKIGPAGTTRIGSSDGYTFYIPREVEQFIDSHRNLSVVRAEEA